VQCWGNNDFGELGDGTTIMRSSPVSVVGLSNVKKIASGGSFTCAATEDGSAKCWGANIFGRLGLNSAIAMSTVPTNVIGISNVIDIAAGAAHACAINSSGDVYCWGDNTYGQTSDLITHTVSAPIKVNGLPAKAASVATGYDNTCVILVTGQGHCWGRDNYAYKNGVSDISYDFYNIPQPIVVTAQSLASIELGRDHTCALGTNGAVMCWGSGQYFQTSFNNSNATPQYVLNIGGAQLAMPLVIKN
jgi:alpha-tubulin suppressor-like RCC1 family protein